MSGQPLQPFPASKVLSSLSVPCPLRNLMRISAVPRASGVELAHETIETCQVNSCLADRVRTRILGKAATGLDATWVEGAPTVEKRASGRTELHLNRPASEDANKPSRHVSASATTEHFAHSNRSVEFTKSCNGSWRHFQPVSRSL